MSAFCVILRSNSKIGKETELRCTWCVHPVHSQIRLPLVGTRYRQSYHTSCHAHHLGQACAYTSSLFSISADDTLVRLKVPNSLRWSAQRKEGWKAGYRPETNWDIGREAERQKRELRTETDKVGT